MLDAENEAILLEDVKALGYKNLKNEDPISYSHALLVVQELGKLHAVSFAMKDQNNEMFNELLQNLKGDYFTEFSDKNGLDLCYQNWIAAAQITLDKEKEKVIYNKMEILKKQYYKILVDVLSTSFSEGCAVICHGDVWIGNLLFKYSFNGEPESVCFLDWQIARYGSPALDLLQFLFTCTDKLIRDHHYKDLTNTYYNSFCEHLQQLGSDPKKLFLIESLYDHLKKFSVFGLCMAIQVTWLTLNISNDKLLDLDTSTESEVKKIRDHFNSPNTEKYTKRIRDVILDYFKLGYEL